MKPSEALTIKKHEAQLRVYEENINSLSIADLGGNLVYVKSSINLQKLDINISDLSPGAYFVYVKSYSAITKIFKLIKI
jgi:hypothetical protein